MNLCARCDRLRYTPTRGLCPSCYATCTRNGTLADYPRVRRTSDELFEDVVTFVGRGIVDLGELADRIGAQPASIVRMLERHRSRLLAAGQPVRAVDRVLVPLRAQIARPWPRERAAL